MMNMRAHEEDHPGRDGGTGPMALSHDDYHGHVNLFIVENQVTWLACAAAWTVWSTMLGYYLEEPYGTYDA